MAKIKIVTLEGQEGTSVVDKFPDTCPICHTSVSPKKIEGTISGNGELEIVFQCTKQNCKRLFIGIYYYVPRGESTYRYVWPETPQKVTVPDNVEKVSPTFVEIYNQALASESMELHQLTGIGLRKALEFLVKDFSISRIEGDGEEIEADKKAIRSKMLGRCINEHIDDERLKSVAKRAAWLGNDETHYIRKWEDKDIADLKLLIKLCVNWVENILLTDEFEKSMPD
ncbi:MAG: hypothetical protein OXI72_02700 [Gemmatimonadota bacterium]|nr:hypothetical protein [Gemmatimonadota bacterium]